MTAKTEVQFVAELIQDKADVEAQLRNRIAELEQQLAAGKSLSVSATTPEAMRALAEMGASQNLIQHMFVTPTQVTLRWLVDTGVTSTHVYKYQRSNTLARLKAGVISDEIGQFFNTLHRTVGEYMQEDVLEQFRHLTLSNFTRHSQTREGVNTESETTLANAAGSLPRYVTLENVPIFSYSGILEPPQQLHCELSLTVRHFGDGEHPVRKLELEASRQQLDEVWQRGIQAHLQPLLDYCQAQNIPVIEGSISQ